MDTVSLTSNETLLLLAGIGVIVIALIAVFALRGPRRHAALKRRFGPEYDRAVQQYGSVARAERELLAREQRINHLHLRELREAERVQFSADWQNVQAKFVDDPSLAVAEADKLIKAVMLARGYAVEKFDQRVADLSVEHANVVQHYRAARALADANREGRANTEELRQAFVHYRALFAALLERGAEVADQRLREAHV